MKDTNMTDKDFDNSYEAFKRELNKMMKQREEVSEEKALNLFSNVWDKRFGYGPFYAKDIKSVMNEMHEYIIE